MKPAPDRGDVRLDGRSLLEVAPERRGISMMFEKPLLFPHLDVLDNIAFADRAAGMPRSGARAAARGYNNIVHLAELARRRRGSCPAGRSSASRSPGRSQPAPGAPAR